MGIFTRFKDIVTSNISSILDKAEDPKKLIRMMIREMEETLVELKSNCAGVMADCARSRRELEAVNAEVEKWDTRAELAIEKGREDLAKEALIEKNRFEKRAEKIQEELIGYDTLASQQREDITLLEEKLNTTKERQQLLLKRHTGAKIRKQAREDVGRASGFDAVRRFEELENRIEHMEAEADIAGPAQTNLESAFSKLEDSDKIDDELSKLKSRVAEKNKGE